MDVQARSKPKMFILYLIFKTSKTSSFLGRKLLIAYMAPWKPSLGLGSNPHPLHVKNSHLFIYSRLI